MAKEFVIIQSSKNINVTAGLQHEDVTNPDAHIPDRLKVNPLWPKLTCFIKQGVGTYPSYITEWLTVKALVKDKVLTIGEYMDSADEQVAETKAKLDNSVAEVETKTKSKSLADIAK